MKSKKNLLDQLKPLPHFTKNMVSQFDAARGLADSTVSTYVSRFIKSKEIIQLKNGFYVTTDFFENNKSDGSYIFYLANVVRVPSYVSSWTALQHYDLVTDVVHGITSVTPKVTRQYQTKAGLFMYQSIKQELFTDFVLSSGQFDFYVASPAKALFDLLYFRTNQFRGVSKEGIIEYIAELRIDFDEMAASEQTKFYSMIEGYE